MLTWIRRLIAAIIWMVALPVLAVALVAPLFLPLVTARDAVTSWWFDLPVELLKPVVPERSTILDANGDFLAEVYLYNRQVISADAISPLIKDAVVATEDKRFYQHAGVDLEGLGRAMLTNLKEGGWVQGGSTLTQQYVKNLVALQDLNGRPDLAWQKASAKTLDRKLREARLAMLLERQLSKEDILTGYLNTASFGNQTYGVEAAAKYYFGLPASEVSLGQAALLAGLLQSPTAYDPFRNPKLAAKRRSVVLDRLLATGRISRDEMIRAALEPLPTEPTAPPGRCPKSRAPFYCAWVEEQLLETPFLGATYDERRQRLAQGGLVIRTALDPRVQAAADKAALRVPQKHRLATAIAMVEPGTGKVRALATNRTWGSDERGETELMLPTRDAFQTGSVFKPLTVAAALNAGVDPDTVLPAGVTYKSRTFKNPEKGYFANYNATPWKNLSIRSALQWSVNTAFVQLQEKTGTLTVAQTAKALGLRNLPLEGENAIEKTEGSLTLGARETSVLNVANAYASLAAGGVACPPRGIVSVETTGGIPVNGKDAGCKQVVSPAAAALTTDMLVTVVKSGTGVRAALGKRPAAGKTGTTNNSAAIWFAGYTPQLATAVWIGDPRGPKFSVDGALGYESATGGTVPATIWKQAMAQALKGQPRLPLAGSTDLSILGGPTAKADQRAGLAWADES